MLLSLCKTNSLWEGEIKFLRGKVKLLSWVKCGWVDSENLRTSAFKADSGNTKRGSITVPLTSCLTGLDKSVSQIKTKIVSCHTADSKPVKQEVKGRVILPHLVFPGRFSSLRIYRSQASMRSLCTCQCNSESVHLTLLLTQKPVASTIKFLRS